MSEESTTVRSVRLKYAAEDAIRLADELVTCGLYDLAGAARAIGVGAMDARMEEEGRGAAAPSLFSVKA